MAERNALGVKTKTPVVKVTCSDCLYFQRMATFDKPCAKLGILTKSEPCIRFTPEIFQLMDPGSDEQSAVVRRMRLDGKQKISPLELLGRMKRQDLQRFAALALAEHASRRRGYYAGQLVYVQISGDSSDPYLNCFVKAWVLHTTREHVIVRGTKTNFSGFYTLDNDHVLTEKQWKKLKKKLLKNGKINAPRSPKSLKFKKNEEEHEPPAIDGLNTVEIKNGTVTLRDSRQ